VLELLRMILGGVGAGLILTALAFVTLLIGVLVTSMVILMHGPIIDRLVKDQGPGSSS
jgi:hypothetical protein